MLCILLQPGALIANNYIRNNYLRAFTASVLPVSVLPHSGLSAVSEHLVSALLHSDL